ESELKASKLRDSAQLRSQNNNGDICFGSSDGNAASAAPPASTNFDNSVDVLPEILSHRLPLASRSEPLMDVRYSPGGSGDAASNDRGGDADRFAHVSRSAPGGSALVSRAARGLPGALEGAVGHVPQTRLGRGKYQISFDNAHTPSPSTANERRPRGPDKATTEGMAQALRMVTKSFAIATVIVAGGAAVAVAATFRALDVQTLEDLPVKGKAAIQPRIDAIAQWLSPLNHQVQQHTHFPGTFLMLLLQWQHPSLKQSTLHPAYSVGRPHDAAHLPLQATCNHFPGTFLVLLLQRQNSPLWHSALHPPYSVGRPYNAAHPALQQCKWHLADGKVQGADGKVQGADGRVRGADGKVQGTDGKVQGADGKVQGADGKVRGADGKVQGADGKVRGADGKVRGADGKVRGADGKVRGADGKVQGADGNVQGADGKVQGADGKVRGADGKVQGADGKVRGADGKVRGADGKVQGADGKVRGADGKVRGADGKVRGADGKVRGADGKVQGADGNVQGADGKVQGADGKVRGADGKVQGADGKERGADGKVRGADGKVRGADGKVQGADVALGDPPDDVITPVGATSAGAGVSGAVARHCYPVVL
ncbi:unnamed protein product, partial [Closterium sp. Naga37s-1]